MIEIVALLLVILACFSYAIWCRDMLVSVLWLAAGGIAATLCFLLLQAPDVAMAEAAVGVGMLPFIYITLALAKTKRFEE